MTAPATSLGKPSLTKLPLYEDLDLFAKLATSKAARTEGPSLDSSA